MGEDVQPGGIEIGHDVGACLAVFVVSMPGGNTRPGFDQHLQAQSGQLLYGFRRRSYPPFAFPALPRNAQLHPPLPFQRVQPLLLWGVPPGRDQRSGTAARSWLESMAQGRAAGG